MGSRKPLQGNEILKKFFRPYACNAALGASYVFAKQFGQQFIENFREVSNGALLYRGGASVRIDSRIGFANDPCSNVPDRAERQDQRER